MARFAGVTAHRVDIKTAGITSVSDNAESIQLANNQNIFASTVDDKQNLFFITDRNYVGISLNPNYGYSFTLAQNNGIYFPFPFKSGVTPNTFAYIGSYYPNPSDLNTEQKWFVALANNGYLVFFMIPFSGANQVQLSGITTIIDQSIKAVNATYTITKIITGKTYTQDNGQSGQSKFKDIVVMFQTAAPSGGYYFDYAFLDQSTVPDNSRVPYRTNSQGVVNNPWASKITYTPISPGPNGSLNQSNFPDIVYNPSAKAFFFAQGNLSTFAGASLKASGNGNYPTAAPVLTGTRDFTQFSHVADAYAFDTKTKVALANWSSFAILTISSALDSNNIYITSANNYISSVTVS